MYERIQELILFLLLESWKEIGIDAGKGMGILFFCMLAFFCIVSGIFIDSRCACVYCITPEGKKKLLGDVYIKENRGGFTAVLPQRFLEKSGSIYYYMEIPAEFTGSHYMEQLFLETPMGTKLVPVRKKIHFKIGLGEQLAPIRFS